MLYNKRLGVKHVIKPKIVLEMIQLLIESRLFILGLKKQNFGVQTANSSYSLKKVLILYTPQMQK